MKLEIIICCMYVWSQNTKRKPVIQKNIFKWCSVYGFIWNQIMRKFRMGNDLRIGFLTMNISLQELEWWYKSFHNFSNRISLFYHTRRKPTTQILSNKIPIWSANYIVFQGEFWIQLQNKKFWKITLSILIFYLLISHLKK